MVTRVSGKVVKWILLVAAVAFVVLYIGNMFLTLRSQVHARDLQHQVDIKAIAVKDAQIKDGKTALENLHVTLNAPAPNVTVTAPPGSPPSIITVPGSTRVVPVPTLVPELTSSPIPTPAPTPDPCRTIHVLFLCL